MLFEKKERSYMTHRLNNQQHILLTLLMRESNLSPSDLAESLDITKSAISQQLKILEDKKYIVRKQDKTDKRVVTIKLAENGRRYQEEMKQFYENVNQTYETHLTKEELKEMYNSLDNLRKVVQNL